MKEIEIKRMPQLPFDVTEALNQLRINLGFCGEQIKTIMVTSSVPNEGKSFITMQLWKMMAEVGTPVLLVDCDFRNSEMRRKYSISSANQKLGILTPVTEIARTIWSMILFRRIAEITPNRMPSRAAIMIANSASSIVAG